MKKYKKQIKIANLLLRSLARLKDSRQQAVLQKLDEFSGKCSVVTKDTKIFQSAIDRKWYKAAEKIRSRISRNLSEFSYSLDQFRTTVNTDDTELPKLTDIIAELSQIEQEFGSFSFDRVEKAISIVTESITLEDIVLGPFEIKLFLNNIDKIVAGSPYKIIAINPNPAGTNSDVTHPHVSCEQLCEGDGHIPIQKSIQHGRLCDFFTIIVQILQTYNPDSPYVSIYEWEGVPCHDCGCTVTEDNCYYCEDCEYDYCSECSSYCQICETTICLGCSYECPICQDHACSHHCTAVCEECEETLCKNCINEDGLCNNCQEQRKEQEDEEQQTIPTTEPEIHSDSLGKTALHA